MSATRYKRPHVDIFISLEMARERNRVIKKTPGIYKKLTWQLAGAIGWWPYQATDHIFLALEFYQAFRHRVSKFLSLCLHPTETDDSPTDKVKSCPFVHMIESVRYKLQLLADPKWSRSMLALQGYVWRHQSIHSQSASNFWARKSAGSGGTDGFVIAATTLTECMMSQ